MTTHKNCQPVHVHVSTCAFRLVQLLAASFHIASIGYFSTMGALYWFLPTWHLMLNLSLYSLTLDSKYFSIFSIGHFCFALVHFGYLVYPLLQRSRQLNKVLDVFVSTRDMKPIHRPERHHLVNAISMTFRRTWNLIFSRLGLFGFENPHFETVFAVRKLVETALQTQQAYKMSCLLPRALLNRSFVALLVLNCWSGPLIARFPINDEAMTRLLQISFDLFVDFVATMVPMYLAASYTPDWDSELHDFAWDFWYTEPWLVHIMNEVQLILLSSWIDVVRVSVLSISMVGSLRVIRRVIRPARPHQSVVVRQKSSIHPVPITHPEMASDQNRKRFRQNQLIFKWITRGATIGKVALGVAVLAVHTHADFRSTAPSCEMQIRPWFASKPTCALVQMHCLTSVDDSSPRQLNSLATVLNSIEPAFVELLVIRHCSELELPSQISTLRQLAGLKLYNVSIAEWGEEGGLTEQSHPRLRYAFFVRTNFTDGELPPGFLMREFPRLLLDIEFFDTNLAKLPEDLDQRWPRDLNLFIEQSVLTSVPEVLSKMGVSALSFAGSPALVSVPIEVLTTPSLYAFICNNCPIRRLGEFTRPNQSADSLKMLYLINSSLEVTPKWMTEEYLRGRRVHARGTPVCQNHSDSKPSPGKGTINCNETGRTSYYPIVVDESLDEGK